MQCGPLEKEQMLSREETIFFLKVTSPKDQMLFGHQERDPKSLEEMITSILKVLSTKDQMQCGLLEKEQML